MLGALLEIHNVLPEVKWTTISHFCLYSETERPGGTNLTSDRPFQAQPGCSPASPSPAGTQTSPGKAQALRWHRATLRHPRKKEKMKQRRIEAFHQLWACPGPAGWGASSLARQPSGRSPCCCSTWTCRVLSEQHFLANSWSFKPPYSLFGKGKLLWWKQRRLAHLSGLFFLQHVREILFNLNRRTCSRVSC